MQNKVLAEIREFAIRKLNQAHLYAALTERETSRIINSSHSGSDIEITININTKPE